MVILCGNRRLVSYAHGWRIEIRKVVQSGAHKGQERWIEDVNAYPASLSAACESLLERVLADGPDLTIDQLPEALKTAAATVRRYMESARSAA